MLSETMVCMIKRHTLKGGDSSDIRSLLLNKNQISLLRKISSQEVTSSWVSKLLDVSIQNASSKLERLRKAGYLTRENRGDPTGGDMFFYECTPLVLNT